MASQNRNFSQDKGEKQKKMSDALCHEIYETVEATAKPHLQYHIGYLRFMQHSTGRASPVYAFPAKNAGSTTLAA